MFWTISKTTICLTVAPENIFKQCLHIVLIYIIQTRRFEVIGAQGVRRRRRASRKGAALGGATTEKLATLSDPTDPARERCNRRYVLLGTRLS